MPGSMFGNLQQNMCIFAIVKYRSNIGGMSDGDPRMISVLLKFIFVSFLIEIQALTLVQKGTTLSHSKKRWWYVSSCDLHRSHKLQFFIAHLHSLALMPIILWNSLHWKLLILVEIVKAYSFFGGCSEVCQHQCHGLIFLLAILQLNDLGTVQTGIWTCCMHICYVLQHYIVCLVWEVYLLMLPLEYFSIWMVLHWQCYCTEPS